MQNLSYDLNTWKCDKVPKLRYIDNPETWAVTFTGRTLKPVTSWRAAIETSRKSGPPCVIARIESGFSLSGDTLTFPADCFFEDFRNAVLRFDSGRELNFALYGLDSGQRTAEYMEFEILGFPAVDPPGMTPKKLFSLREYYTAREVNELFCFYVGARNVVDIYDGEALVTVCPMISAYDLNIAEDGADVNVEMPTNYPDFIPACGYLWLHIDKKSTGPLTFSPGIHWMEGDGAYPVDFRAYAESPGIDFTSPGMYRLLFSWSPEYDNEPAYWYNFAENNEIELYQE